MLHHYAGATIQVANFVNYSCHPLEDGNESGFAKSAHFLKNTLHDPVAKEEALYYIYSIEYRSVSQKKYTETCVMHLFTSINYNLNLFAVCFHTICLVIISSLNYAFCNKEALKMAWCKSWN